VLTVTKVVRTALPKVATLLHGLIVLSLFMIGSDFAAIQGGFAHTLHLPLAYVAMATPILAPGVYAGVGYALRGTLLRNVRWILACLLAAATLGLPTWILTTGSRPILLTRWLQPDEQTAVRAVFPHPFVHYSATGKGIRLLIRRDDCDSKLIEYLASIHAIES
jgi:hypothetical protein